MQAFHNEVANQLVAVSPTDTDVGERIRIDRGSHLQHLGLRTPTRRKLVKAGFSFYDQDDEGILEVWDGIWKLTHYADVLFAVLDYYRERLQHGVPSFFWPVAADWITKIDNWAHADDLARVYSWALSSNPDQVHPTLIEWNQLESLWHRRISIVSLVRYSGKNAVILPPDQVFPLLENCVDDDRAYIQKAVGWVVREMSGTYPTEAIRFLEQNRNALSRQALRRATERFDLQTQTSLRDR